MSYLIDADITDKVALAFAVDIVNDYFDEVDGEINDLAAKLGIDTDDIDTDFQGTGRIAYKIRRFGIAYCLYRFFEDRAGVNDVDFPETEKYYMKSRHYYDKQKSLRSEITAELFVDDVEDGGDRAIGTSRIYRG